jgi:hypothetical protein
MPQIKRIQDLPKGARRDPVDRRDFSVHFAAPAPTPVDWGNGSGLPRPTLIDQGSSDCCVACSWSYYHWQLRGQEFSRRDLFARIALSPPGSGAYIRDGGLALVNQGQATETDLPDPVPETEANTRDNTGVTVVEELAWKEYNSFTTAVDIESVARAIGLYRGVVGGVYGTNAGWADLTVPESPQPGEMANLDALIASGDVWEHALYLLDFHIHANTDGSQEECIIAATSWPSAGIVEHHLRARYFTAGATFNPWTLLLASTVASIQQNVKVTLGAAAGV